ncbi:hypothetical protein ACLOJK_011475 [Asimina triloba]
MDHRPDIKSMAKIICLGIIHLELELLLVESDNQRFGAAGHETFRKTIPPTVSTVVMNAFLNAGFESRAPPTFFQLQNRGLYFYVSNKSPPPSLSSRLTTREKMADLTPQMGRQRRKPRKTQSATPLNLFSFAATHYFSPKEVFLGDFKGSLSQRFEAVMGEMGQQTSKEELLYHQVSYGNVEGIKRLREDGAGLEWVDREGKTPLMVACMNPDLFDVAKALIELGANVNAYCRRFHAGTILHYAAKRGLDQTVKLLLSHGANALVTNNEFQSPLDVARAKGHLNVVRIIEVHLQFVNIPGLCDIVISAYSRVGCDSFMDQGFLKHLFLNGWAVIVPRNSRDRNNPLKLELAIYPAVQSLIANSSKEMKQETSSLESADASESFGKAEEEEEEKKNKNREKAVIMTVITVPVILTCQLKSVGLKGREAKHNVERRAYAYAAHPSVIIQLWKVSIEEPNFNEPDPSLVINEKKTKKRFKFLSANEGDKEQLEWFYNACRGMHQLADLHL